MIFLKKAASTFLVVKKAPKYSELLLMQKMAHVIQPTIKNAKFFHFNLTRHIAVALCNPPWAQIKLFLFTKTLRRRVKVK